MMWGVEGCGKREFDTIESQELRIYNIRFLAIGIR